MCIRDRHYSALIGLAAPLACLVLFGSSSFLLPSMGCILILLLALGLFASSASGSKVVKGGIKGVLPVLIIMTVLSLAARLAGYGSCLLYTSLC